MFGDSDVRIFGWMDFRINPNRSLGLGWFTNSGLVYFDVFGSLNYDDPPYGEVGSGNEIDPNRSYYLGI